MQGSPKIFPLAGRVQHYSWGGTEFIPKLLGYSNPSATAYAEYWLGAHQNAPSLIPPEAEAGVPLDQYIKQNASVLLGERVNRKFGRLPYLLKVLDVKDMLSIQVHPAKSDAEIEFEAENLRGVALQAGHRNYKDDNHKPELMLALSSFWLLHGFKPVTSLKSVLQKVPELQFLLPVFGDGNYRALYEKVMLMEQKAVNNCLAPLMDRILPLYEEGKLNKSEEDFWAARAYTLFCQPDRIDRGIFSIYLFNLVHLQPGQAIFQDAGVPHAYLEGQNIELMANSDNVLRGGLTSKHIDVAELMKHVRFHALEPHIIEGLELPITGEKLYPSPASDFELRSLELEAGEESRISIRSADIFLMFSGEAMLLENGTVLHRQRGEAAIAFAGAEMEIRALSPCLLFHATVPIPESSKN